MIAAGVLWMSGCEQTSPDGIQANGTVALDTYIDARPAAFIEGRSLTWGEMQDQLTEAAGAEVLRDVILDRRLIAAVAQSGVDVTDDAIDAERTLLLESLDEDPDVAERLLEMLRDRRRLGPVRFAALLRRNAALRALIRDEVQVTEAMREATWDTLYGPRRTVRLIVAGDRTEAESIVEELAQGADFGDVATRRSDDASAARAGLLAPISRRDPTYPEALRRTIFDLAGVGSRSPAFVLGDGFGIVALESITEAAEVDRAVVMERVERLSRAGVERALMDRTARQLVGGASVNIIDRSLVDAWKRSLRDRGRERATSR